MEQKLAIRKGRKRDPKARKERRKNKKKGRHLG